MLIVRFSPFSFFLIVLVYSKKHTFMYYSLNCWALQNLKSLSYNFLSFIFCLLLLSTNSRSRRLCEKVPVSLRTREIRFHFVSAKSWGNKSVNTVLYRPSMFNHDHRWASTSISMSAISDIWHRHLLFQYRRQICRTEKRHSDIGSVPISTSEFIPISDIEEKDIFLPADTNPRPWKW
jgi:hypothetical protein